MCSLSLSPRFGICFPSLFLFFCFLAFANFVIFTACFFPSLWKKVSQGGLHIDPHGTSPVTTCSLDVFALLESPLLGLLSYVSYSACWPWGLIYGWRYIIKNSLKFRHCNLWPWFTLVRPEILFLHKNAVIYVLQTCLPGQNYSLFKHFCFFRITPFWFIASQGTYSLYHSLFFLGQ